MSGPPPAAAAAAAAAPVPAPVPPPPPPLPSQAVGFEILTIVYEQILARAGVVAGAPPAAYQQLIAECDNTFAINNGRRVEIAFQRYFGLRANPPGTIGAAFAARLPWPGGPPAVQAYIGALPPLPGTPTLSFDRTATFYILGINDRADGAPVLHITIPRNPLGLGAGHPTNYTMHFTDEATGQHIYHPFADPRGAVIAVPALAAAAPVAAPAAAPTLPPGVYTYPRLRLTLPPPFEVAHAPVAAVAGVPAAQGWRARAAAAAAAAAAAPPAQETGLQRMLRLAAERRRGGRRKTKRSKRGRRTRRR